MRASGGMEHRYGRIQEVLGREGDARGCNLPMQVV